MKFIDLYLILGAIAFLVLGVIAANVLAAAADITPQSYTRIFYYREGPRARESLFTYPSSIDVLAPQSYSFNGSGNLLGKINATVLAFAKKNKIKIMPLVTNGNFSKTVSRAFLDDPAKQDLAIKSLVDEAKKKRILGLATGF